MRITVIVDDDDRADAPERAWTATVKHGPENLRLLSGCGTSPGSALTELAHAFAQEERWTRLAATLAAQIERENRERRQREEASRQ